MLSRTRSTRRGVAGEQQLGDAGSQRVINTPERSPDTPTINIDKEIKRAEREREELLKLHRLARIRAEIADLRRSLARSSDAGEEQGSREISESRGRLDLGSQEEARGSRALSAGSKRSRDEFEMSARDSRYKKPLPMPEYYRKSLGEHKK